MKIETEMLRQLSVARAENEAPLNGATVEYWSAVGTFAGAVVLLLMYVVAAASGWISWAAWMPVVLSFGFVAWGAAVRIRRVNARS